MKKRHTPKSPPPVVDAHTTQPQNSYYDEQPKADFGKLAAFLSMMPVTQDERLQRKQDRFDEQNNKRS